MLHKTQKTEIAIFPLYFLGFSFIIFNEFVGGSNDFKIKKFFFFWPMHIIEHKNPKGQKIWTIFTIFTPPYFTSLRKPLLEVWKFCSLLHCHNTDIGRWFVSHHQTTHGEGSYVFLSTKFPDEELHHRFFFGNTQLVKFFGDIALGSNYIPPES